MHIPMLLPRIARKPIAAALLIPLLAYSAAGQQQRVENAKDAQEDGTIKVPMELFANRPIVRVKIGEQGPFALFVTPEAQASVLDDSVLGQPKSEKRGAPGQTEVEVAAGDTRLKIGLGDTSHLLPDLTLGSRVRGILSATAWPNRLVTLDYPRWQIVVEPGGLPEPNHQDVFSLKPGSSDSGVELAIGDLAIACTIDPMFPGGFLLPDSTVRQLLTIDRAVDIGATTIATGSIRVQEVQLAANVRVGSFEFAKPAVQFSSAADRCRIGGQTLMRFSVTYDLTNARIRLTPRTT